MIIDIEERVRAAFGQLAARTTIDPRARFEADRDPSERTTSRRARVPGGRRWSPVLGFATLGVVCVLVVAALARRDTTAPADSVPEPTHPVPTSAVEGDPFADPIGVVTFASTHSALRTWPELTTSGRHSDNAGYGLWLCDDSTSTKYAELTSADRHHWFEGTLCPQVTLQRPMPRSVAGCASVTPGTQYARCQRRPAQTDVPTTDPPSLVGTDAPLIVPPTPADLAPRFDTTVSGAGAWRVADAEGRLCYSIAIADAQVDGCLHDALLATGLAYGAFGADDGPIELVGIVPDDVTRVVVDGQDVPIVDNLWRTTVPAGTAVTIMVAGKGADAAVG